MTESNLRKKCILLIVPERWSPSWRGSHGMVAFHQHTGSRGGREREQEMVVPGYRPSKLSPVTYFQWRVISYLLHILPSSTTHRGPSFKIHEPTRSISHSILHNIWDSSHRNSPFSKPVNQHAFIKISLASGGVTFDCSTEHDLVS